jgi:hypothetical protein
MTIITCTELVHCTCLLCLAELLFTAAITILSYTSLVQACKPHPMVARTIKHVVELVVLSEVRLH